ncbi:MAG: AAA family ATPase, partial [Candidatus Micrarchaeota archaeon]|nr:AAA family ATPase [Candidatus Micrarchaeota archaeon]
SPGAGKTTCAKHAMKQLSDYRPTVNCVYINCWENNTKSAVLNEIGRSIEIGFPRRGLANDEVFTRIIEFSKKSKATNIIFLDEFDQLVYKKEDGVVYDLTRAGENHGANFSVVLISNDSHLLEKLDQRIASSLSAKKVCFPRYSPQELKDILRERAKLCFRSGSWSEEAIALCAGHAAKLGGDCRVALRTLWRAARVAENQGNKITETHVRKAFENEKQTTQPQSEVEEKILQELTKEKNAAGITAGELYAALPTYSERTLRTHLDNLISRGGVEAREVEGKEAGGRGRTRMVKLK